MAPLNRTPMRHGLSGVYAGTVSLGDNFHSDVAFKNRICVIEDGIYRM
jgi:hypothetical protein